MYSLKESFFEKFQREKIHHSGYIMWSIAALKQFLNDRFYKIWVPIRI